MMLMIHMIPKVFIMLPVLILFSFAVIGVIVLLIKLCSKRPWIVVIIALGLLLIVPYFVLVSSYRPASRNAEVTLPSTLPPSQQTTTSIWLPGIEDQFKANIYPSKLSAVRSLGLHIAEPVKQVYGEVSPSGFILFQGAHERDLIEDFGKAISKTFPDAKWTIAPETVAVQPDEVGIRIDIVNVHTHPAPWNSGSENEMTTGTVRASVLAADRQASMSAEFVDKPWVEDFSGFLNTRPNSRFIIAKSTESCMTEAEANNKAVENACNQVADMLGQTLPRKPGVPVSFTKPVDSTDILEGNFILDRFVQSLEGSAGKIWRQALLVDASAEKLKNLAHRKAVIARARKTGFARMFFSIVGLIVLIAVVYAFLNAATKGYYVWSLRIAGVVFALVVIILLLV
ncbi:MAG: hypothetical protein JXA81_15055 [Sedimentisphaerales bacterium]|nr:hypothetical protein [Sedimentisphaerales bacterium]